MLEESGLEVVPKEIDENLCGRKLFRCDNRCLDLPFRCCLLEACWKIVMRWDLVILVLRDLRNFLSPKFKLLFHNTEFRPGI